MRADVFIRKMQESLTLARKFLAAAQDRQAAYANRGRREVHFETGELVLWDVNYRPIGQVQLAPRFIGPLKIISGTSDDHPNTVIMDLPEEFIRTTNTINVNALRKYHAPPGAEIPINLPPPVVERNPDTGKKDFAWRVDHIVDHRQQPGPTDEDIPQWNADGSVRYQYLVKWGGYSTAWNSWEPLESFFPGSISIVREYHRSHRLGRVPIGPDGVEESFDAPEPRSRRRKRVTISRKARKVMRALDKLP